MKKRSRIIAILMAIELIFVTGAISVFANEGDPEQAEVQIAAPVLIGAYPDYHSVTVKWNAVPGAEKYVIVRDGVDFAEVAGTETSFRDKDAAKDVNYTYAVKAVAGSSKSEASLASAATGRVRTAYYYCTFGANVTLKSHDGAKKKVTFKKGQVVQAEGFSQGSYKFDYNGRPYEAKWFRMKKTKGNINKNAYVNGVTATNYVNNAAFTSKTNYLIWISLYSQRVFVFQKNAATGLWEIVNTGTDGLEGYLCGSGKAKFPTPTGMNKSLHKKMKKYSKHKWWNCFSGTNAVHGSNGKKEIKKLGKLISNGCVRVTNEQAIWIFKNVPLKTRVIVF